MSQTNQILLEAQRLERWDNTEDINEILSVIREGTILEVGCGTGKIIKELAHSLQNSFFVGIDIVEYFLDLAVEKQIRNALFIRVNAVVPFSPDRTFDTVLFRDSLHEIRDNQGDEGVEKALENAYHALKDDGVIIIRDAIRPPTQKIRVTFESDTTKDVFSICMKLLSRTTPVERSTELFEIDVCDLIAFLGNFMKITQNPDLNQLQEGKHYTRDEYIHLLQTIGFTRSEVRFYKFPRKLVPKGVIFDFQKLPETYCMFVYTK
jgi:SAM-dependent methyltransferase